MDPGDLIDDRYRLEGRIGSGGMAEVWRALDTRLNRHVALKFLAVHFSDEPDNLVRFFSEAQSLARVQHPNVVTVLDFGTVEGRPFLVMECVSGGTLADRMGHPIDPREAIDIIHAVAGGAGAAHDLDIVHRDIKPGNILMAEGPRPKLADFGIASYSGAERLTVSGVTVGSPSYISPEQATDKPTTPRSDVYAIGVVLYEMLAGRRPFENNSLSAIVIAHVEEKPAPPSTHVAGLPPELDALVMKCLAKDPARRYANGTELARALGLVAKSLRGAVSAVVPPVESKRSETQRRRLAGGRIALAGTLAAVAVAAFLLLGLRDDGAPERPPESKPRRDIPAGAPRGTNAAPEASDVTEPSPAESPSPEPAESPSPEAREAEDGAVEPEGEEAGVEEPSPTPTPTPTPAPSPSPSETPGATSAEVPDDA